MPRVVVMSFYLSIITNIYFIFTHIICNIYWCGDKLNCNNSTSSRNTRHRVFVFFGSRIRLIRQAFHIHPNKYANIFFSWETECDKATSTSPLTQPSLDDAYLSHTCRAHFCIYVEIGVLWSPNFWKYFVFYTIPTSNSTRNVRLFEQIWVCIVLTYVPQQLVQSISVHVLRGAV